MTGSYNSIFFQNTQQHLADGYTIRPLCIHDYDRGYTELLFQLSETNVVLTKNHFEELFHKCRQQNIHIVVIEEEDSHLVVATGTVLIEPKFLRGGTAVGHIEDIVVDRRVRGMHFASLVVRQLLRIAQSYRVYKCILDCSDENVAFYEKLDFKKENAQMCIRLSP